MKYTEILAHVGQFGGLTLNKDLTPINEKKGFMVSLYGLEKQFKITDTNEIIQTIKEYQTRLKNNDYLGFWFDNDIFYIDISRHYQDRQKAVKKGIKEKQLAIFDISKDKSIYLTKKAYIIYKYNKINNDIEYIKEFYSINDISQEFKIKSESVYNYIVQDIDNLESYKNLLNNNYIIKIDNILINEI
jgi:predicted DNA-binding protein YlxM (UPF0122 family)